MRPHPKSSGWRQFYLCGLLVFGIVLGCTTSPASPSSKAGHTETGQGLFLVDFDYATGRVTNVRVLKSTGNATYDAITLQKFRHWDCKPRTYRRLKVPISYQITYDGT